MKNFFFLAAVALGAAVCSCSTDILDQPEFNGSEMMVEASGFDGKDAASYISWIKISRQGTGELTYRTELKYAEGCDTLLPAIEAPSVKHVCDLRPTEGKMLREKTDGPLIIRSYQTEYTVCYADFEVPVLFTTEKAFFSDHDGEYVLPVPEVRYALQEPKLTELADETADGRVTCWNVRQPHQPAKERPQPARESKLWLQNNRSFLTIRLLSHGNDFRLCAKKVPI